MYYQFLGLSCWMETRRGYDHPRSQREDEIFQESRRSLNLEITKLPEPRDTFQTCDIHCILFSSPSVSYVFCDSNKILIFEFLYFYIIPVLVLKPSTGINGCISEARSGKMSKFFGGQSDSESSSSEESSSEEEVNTTFPPPLNHLS